MDYKILETCGALDFISSISSLSNLREIIIFNVLDCLEFSKDAEDALCGLAANTTVTVKVYLARRTCPLDTIRHPDELKYWFDRRPVVAEEYSKIHTYDCVIEFPNYLPRLRKHWRVVLMEERKEGAVVVVHDSYDSSIHCDCGRDTGKELP